MAIPVITMNGETGFPDQVAKLIDGWHGLFVTFRGQ
jgi:hypothetical protein